ncbi:MAG: putative bifunctional diguanylate cyclase/phosphodiesterase [Acidimicrobiales bacterium]
MTNKRQGQPFRTGTGAAATASTGAMLRRRYRLKKLLRDKKAPAVATPGAMGTANALFFISSAVVAVALSYVYPSRDAQREDEAVVAAVAAASGALTLVLSHRLTRRFYQLLVVGATAIVTLLVLLAPAGPARMLLALLYVYVPMDSFFFFALPVALSYALLCDVYIVALGIAGEIPPGESSVLVIVNIVVGVVVAWLVRAAAAAEVDQLTGLPNHAGLQRALQLAIAKARPAGRQLSIALFDVDHFDAYNKAVGHDEGDKLLCTLAHDLQGHFTKEHTVARYGGDSFAVLMPGIGAAQAGELVTPLREQLSARHSCSVGVSEMYPGDTASMFSDRARSALFEAKESGRDRTVVRASHASHAAEVAAGIASGQFVVYFQPIVSLPEGRLLGAEALVRWQHPERGLVGPDDFIPVAEESGLIIELGQFVLTMATSEAASWPVGTKVSVNASARELDQPSYAAQVERLLATTGLRPANLVIEVTETRLAGSQTILANLARLHEAGVGIALDDFGTGYSSLSRFLWLPVDFVKIDRSFVSAIGPKMTAAPVIAAVCALAKATGRIAIAEGVEEEHQAAVLVAHGCTQAQGFLYGRPGPASHLFVPDLSRDDGHVGADGGDNQRERAAADGRSQADGPALLL